MFKKAAEYKKSEIDHDLPWANQYLQDNPGSADQVFRITEVEQVINQKRNIPALIIKTGAFKAYLFSETSAYKAVMNHLTQHASTDKTPTSAVQALMCQLVWAKPNVIIGFDDEIMTHISQDKEQQSRWTICLATAQDSKKDTSTSKSKSNK